MKLYYFIIYEKIEILPIEWGKKDEKADARQRSSCQRGL